MRSMDFSGRPFITSMQSPWITWSNSNPLLPARAGLFFVFLVAKKLRRRVIKSNAMTTDGIDILVLGIQCAQPVAQATYQRIQCLIRHSCRLLLAPHRADEVRAGVLLALVFIG